MTKELLIKNPNDLTSDEISLLIDNVTMLDDNERYKFRNVLVRENLSEEQHKKFCKKFENRDRERSEIDESLFDKYFPKSSNVEEHYQHNFTRWRNSS